MKAFDKLLDFMRLGDDEDYYDDEDELYDDEDLPEEQENSICLAPGTARRKKRTEPPRRRAL